MELKRLFLFVGMFLIMVNLSSALYWIDDLNTSLLGYYEFEGDVLDDHASLDLTNTGTTNASGILGSGRDMDGSNDILDRSTYSASVGDTDSFSVSMWINPDAGASSDYFFRLGDAANPSRALNLNFGDNDITYRS